MQFKIQDNISVCLKQIVYGRLWEDNMAIYFDNSATTRVDPEVVKAMLPFFSEYYGNISSIHLIGHLYEI